MNPGNDQKTKQREKQSALRRISIPEKTVRFLDYLRKNTDREHPVKAQDVKAAFCDMGLHPGSDNTVHDFIVNVANGFNLDAEEHTLPQSQWRIVFDDYVKKYGDLSGEDEDADEEAAWESIHIRNLYYEPEFSHEEIDALIEAVQFSKTLSEEETKKLIGTLEERFASKYYKRGVRGICKFHEKADCDRTLLRENLLTIQRAIEDNVQISYRFNGYSQEKKLTPMGEYKRMVSPYYIVADNGKYYLLAANEEYKNTLILRIDLMTEVSIPERNEITGKKGKPRLPKSEVAGLPERWDAAFPMKHIYMSYDAPVRVKLRIKSEKSARNRGEHVTPDYTFLHDYFGDNYRYLGADEKDPDYDLVAVESSSFGMVHFALQYADRLEVLEPAKVREEIREKVRVLWQKYR